MDNELTDENLEKVRNVSDAFLSRIQEKIPTVKSDRFVMPKCIELRHIMQQFVPEQLVLEQQFAVVLEMCNRLKADSVPDSEKFWQEFLVQSQCRRPFERTCGEDQPLETMVPQRFS